MCKWYRKGREWNKEKGVKEGKGEEIGNNKGKGEEEQNDSDMEVKLQKWK